MAMQAPARNTLQLKAYRVLSHELMIGRHKPGQPFSLRPLAARLGTSPMPVREAVSRLIAERALVLLPNRKVIVPWMTRERFTELSRVRQLLEGRVAEIACKRITPKLLTELGRINAEVKACLAKKEIARALAHNLNFHLTLYNASHVDVMLPMIEMLWRQAGPFIALSPNLPGVRWTARYHDEIIKALKAGSASKTRQAVQRDIEDTLQELLKHAAFEGD
jgi:DNA-binding GntR family transcriptional regulator